MTARRATVLTGVLALAVGATAATAGFSSTTSNPGNTVAAGVLGAPTGLTSLHADAANDGTVTLRWTPATADPRGTVPPSDYLVDRTNPDGTTTTLRVPASVCAGATCQTRDTTAAYNTTYTYRVRSSVASWTAGPTNVRTAASLPPSRAVQRTPGGTYTLNDVAVVAAATGPNVVVVGEAGRIAACSSSCTDNTLARYAPVASPAVNDLHDVFLVDENLGFAVGGGGTVLRCTDVCGTAAAQWSAIPSGTTATLRGVYAASASYVIVVGDGGLIRYSTGGAFITIPSGTVQPLNAVAGRGSGQIVVAGQGVVLACHFNNTSNVCDHNGNDFTTRSVTGGSGVEWRGAAPFGNTAYALVGSAGRVATGSSNGTFTTATSPVPQNLNDVAVQGTSLRAVGDAGAAAVCWPTALAPNVCTTWTSESTGTTQQLLGIAATSSHAWAVGAASTVQHWSSAGWDRQTGQVGGSSDLELKDGELARQDTARVVVPASPSTACGSTSVVASFTSPASAPDRVTVTVSYTSGSTSANAGALHVSAGDAPPLSHELPRGAAGSVQTYTFDLSRGVTSVPTTPHALQVCVTATGGPMTLDVVHVDLDAG